MESAETRLLVAKYNETRLDCSLMIKLPLHKNCFSIQKTILQNIKDFAKKSVTWLYRIVDIIISVTAEIISFDYQFWFKLTGSSILKSSKTLSRYVLKNLSSVSMFHNLPEIRLTYNLWEKKFSQVTCYMIFQLSTSRSDSGLGASNSIPDLKNIFCSCYYQYFHSQCPLFVRCCNLKNVELCMAFLFKFVKSSIVARRCHSKKIKIKNKIKQKMKITKIEKMKKIIFRKKTLKIIMAHECQIWYLVTRLYI